MRLLVCGGRDFIDVPLLWRSLNHFCVQRSIPSLLIEGASDDVTGPYRGADYWARQWANATGIKVSTFHAKWREQGRAAGPIRNKRMIDEAYPQVVMAFPGNRGTANMIEQARAAEIEVIEIGKK